MAHPPNEVRPGWPAGMTDRCPAAADTGFPYCWTYTCRRYRQDSQRLLMLFAEVDDGRRTDAEAAWQRSTDTIGWAVTQSCFGCRGCDPSFRSTRSCGPSYRSPTFCRPARLRKGLEDGRRSERYGADPRALLPKDRRYYGILSIAPICVSSFCVDLAVSR